MKKLIFFSIGGFLIGLSVLLVGWIFVFMPQGGEAHETIFKVHEGMSLFAIARALEEEHLIANRWLFVAYVIAKGWHNDLKAGTYLLYSAMGISTIAQKISSGDVISQTITIVEGWNVRDIGWYLENKGLFMAEELFELVGFPAADYSQQTEFPFPKDFSSEFEFLRDKPKSVGLEGYLFPDTYQLEYGAGVEQAVKMMLANFDRKVSKDLREEIKRQGKSLYEIITMASLIEKEVHGARDRKIVSGILWKRLKAGMPLQVDATISYITGRKTTKISKEETQIDSPYNTYRYAGLPLGPIANPGLESIMAAIYPEESNFWYYLSAPDGKTIFSRTLEEHNRAKAKYLK